jgi:hypothetical protein
LIARLCTAALLLAGPATAAPIDPQRLAVAGTVDPRFQSYNIEMVEVTGGRFWKPYRLGPPQSPADRYAMRPPINLANPRLRMLVAALGPAYVRISGTWANATWLATDETPPAAPPAGFNTILTRGQWRGVAAFLTAVDGELITSFAGSAGVRDASGIWQPDQMQALLSYSTALGIKVAGAEFLNEPNLINLTGAPSGYSAADYGRDFGRFAAAFRTAAPGARILGPGGAGDGGFVEGLAKAAGLRLLPSAALLAASPTPPDGFSYHHYGALSRRCAADGPLSVQPPAALDPTWLARTDTTLSVYRGLRDRHAPGAPIWLTETAQAACGGSPWASGFADTPRYIDQLGRLARQGVQVVMHNTLAASDYGLLDEDDFTPRPNYWAALLWSRMMSPTVLAIETPNPLLRVYAHCLKGKAGGVALVAINLAQHAKPLEFRGQGLAYTLTGIDSDRGAALNGHPLALDRDGKLPPLLANSVKRMLMLPPASVTFVAIPSAQAFSCGGRAKP